MNPKQPEEQIEKQAAATKSRPSLLAKIFYITFTLFLLSLIAGGVFVVYQLNQLTQTAGRVTQPISQLWQQLAVEATPVIMPDPLTIVREINKLSNLETASYSLQKVIIAERNQEALWGALGERLIFEAVGDVTAGINLGSLRQEDIQVIDPDTVMINLPDAIVLNTRLDNQQSRVIDRERGLLSSVDPQLESQVRAAAEQEILEAALEGGILQEADQNAEEALLAFLNQLGFENVIFTEGPPPPAPPFVPEVPKGVIVLTPTPTPAPSP